MGKKGGLLGNLFLLSKMKKVWNMVTKSKVYTQMYYNTNVYHINDDEIMFTPKDQFK